MQKYSFYTQLEHTHKHTHTYTYHTELITTPPDYNPNARHFDPKLYADTTTSEVCPISPPAEVLVDTLTQEWTGKKVESCPEHISEDVWPKAGSSHSIPSMCVSVSCVLCMQGFIQDFFWEELPIHPFTCRSKVIYIGSSKNYFSA